VNPPVFCPLQNSSHMQSLIGNGINCVEECITSTKDPLENERDILYYAIERDVCIHPFSSALTQLKVLFN
jgi:hypothetical protein